jgi:MFS family permease
MPPTPRTHDPYAALRHPNYRFYAGANFLAEVGEQILVTAVGWQLWKLTHSAMALGLCGFAGILPFLLLALPGGHWVDRSNRKSLLLLSQCLMVLCAGALAWLSLRHGNMEFGNWTKTANGLLGRWAGALARFYPASRNYSFTDPSIPVIYFILFLNGACKSVFTPAKSALLSQLVPREDLSNAVTWGSQTMQIGSVAGPALGGLFINGWGFPAVYAICALCGLVFICLILPIQASKNPSTREPMTLPSLAAGVRFVLDTKIILATITMDLFAVLLGGAVALLPIYADDILHVGAVGLGWLRAAVPLGAFTMAVLLTQLEPMERAGKALLWAVAGFGAATVVFGISCWFWLSMAMLFLIGAFDNISVVVRATLVQVLTPDSMRGRVSAVNYMFINSSNELGAAESGLTAALFGPVLSVVGGGIGTILVILGVMALWPQVAQLGSLQDPLKKISGG